MREWTDFRALWQIFISLFNDHMLSYRRRLSHMFFKIGVLKNFAIFTGTICVGVDLQLYQKETPTQVLSWERFESFKKSFFYGAPLVAASERPMGDSFCSLMTMYSLMKIDLDFTSEVKMNWIQELFFSITFEKEAKSCNLFC